MSWRLPADMFMRGGEAVDKSVSNSGTSCAEAVDKPVDKLGRTCEKAVEIDFIKATRGKGEGAMHKNMSFLLPESAPDFLQCPTEKSDSFLQCPTEKSDTENVDFTEPRESRFSEQYEKTDSEKHISISEVDSEKRDAILKVKLLTDFLFFTRWMFKHVLGKQFIVARHHKIIAKALTKVASGEITRLIINVPPRYGKTALAVHMFNAWILANNSASRSIHLSYSDDLALDNSSAIRDIVKHDEFQRMFPVKLRTDNDSKKKWYTDTDGGLYSVASGGAITGFGAGAMERTISGTGSPADGFGGFISIDDPLKPDDSYSDAARTAVNRRYNGTIASRVNSEETPVVVIMQRLNEDDLSGFLLDGGSGEEWVHICLPAINEDPEVGPVGEPLWPEKHSLERLRQMEQADPYTFAGQYQQRPAPIGGGQFKDEWWQFYRKPPQILYRQIYGDTAMKIKEVNDFSVLQCWGRTDKGIVLLDQLRGKWEGPELLKQTVAFWNKHSHVKGMGTLRKICIEDKASGTGLIQSLQRRKDDDGNMLPSIPVKPIQRGIDKIVRANDVSPWVEAGHVSLPQDAPWLSDYLAEFGMFPKGKHDDQIDPTMDAIKDMLQEADMSFIPSAEVCKSIRAGSGHYMGDDPLIGGLYIAKNANEKSFIQFRRGKDACSETSYTINWEKSSDPVRLRELVVKTIEKHKPDMMFIGEAGAGLLCDDLLALGHNITRVIMSGE